ncbi:FUSC family protein [Amorphus sp. 3PC139-8]
MALGVCAPWLAGIAAGHAFQGSIASFGAYLLTVSFPRLPASGRVKVLLASSLIISLFATVGGSVALGTGAFFVLALMAAIAQGVGELRGGYLRLPIALGALAFFLSVGQVPAGSEMSYGISFLLGTLWGAVFVRFCIPAVKEDTNTARPPLLKEAGERRFMAGIASVSLLGSFAACFSPGSHPCWLTAAGLRVTKPTRPETIYRMKTRGMGTLLGAATGGLLLGLSPLPWLHALLVGFLVLCMLMIGAKRYGIWTFCLTAVALAFDLTPEAGALEMASNRVLMTIAGIGIAMLMLPLLPRATKEARTEAPSPSSASKAK